MLQLRNRRMTNGWGGRGADARLSIRVPTLCTPEKAVVASGGAKNFSGKKLAAFSQFNAMGTML